MADNITAKDASGATVTIRFDELSGSIYTQAIKLILGADGAEDLILDSGQQAMAASLPVVLASDQTPIEVEGQECGTVSEYNVTMTSADTEYSQALPSGTRKLTMRVRDGTAARYAWDTGKVATPTEPYQTLRANSDYTIDGISLSGKTIYFACASASKVMEIEAWT